MGKCSSAEKCNEKIKSIIEELFKEIAE